MKRRISTVLISSGTILLMLSMLLSTVSFAATGLVSQNPAPLAVVCGDTCSPNSGGECPDKPFGYSYFLGNCKVCEFNPSQQDPCHCDPNPIPGSKCCPEDPCDDGNPCTTGDVCQPGGKTCAGTPECTGPTQCTAGGACDTASCEAGCCVYDPIPGCCTADAQCDDGNACNGSETCPAAPASLAQH